MRSHQNDCSYDRQRDLSRGCRTQMATKRRAEESSAIDHGLQARTTELYKIIGQTIKPSRLHAERIDIPFHIRALIYIILPAN